MSEKGKRGQNATGKAPAGGDGKKFATGLLKIFGDLEQFRKDLGGLEEYDSLLATRNNLKQELEAKNREIAELKKEATDFGKQKDQEVARLEKEARDVKGSLHLLFTESGSRYASWEKDKNRHAADAAELSRLRSELETTKEAAEKADQDNRQLRKKLATNTEELKESKDNIATLKNTLEMRELSLKDKAAKLEKCRFTLSKVNDNLGILPYEEQDMSDSLEKLADGFHNLAWRYFGSEVPNPTLSISISQPALMRIPLVTSNSPGACYIRTAFAEAAIAQVLLDQIFQDFYYLEEVAGVEAVGVLVSALNRLRETDALEATIIRCQLAKACNRLKAVDRIPIHAAGLVCDIVGSWFGDDAVRKQQFLQELKGIYSEAMSLWQCLQRAPKRVVAVSDLNPRIWYQAEDKRDKYDELQLDSEQPIPAVQSMGPLAVLFPQIEAGETLLFHGLALFDNQSAVLVAARELHSKPDAQARSAQRRRMSREMPKDSVDQRSKADRRLSMSSSTAPWKSGAPTSSELSYLGGAGSTLSSRSRQDPK